MNAFSKALAAFIEHGITAAKWPSQRQFALRVGTNTANLTGILVHGRHPTVATLKEWLAKVEAEPADIERLVSLLSREKALNHAEMAPYVEGAERKLEAARALSRTLLAIVKGGKPYRLPQGIEDIVESL